MLLDLQNAYSGRESLPPESRLQEALQLAAKQYDLAPNWEMSLRLVDDAEIQALNRDFRGKDAVTNVLSFPFESEFAAQAELSILGDVVLAVDRVAAEARQQGKSLEHHFLHLLLHGFLHLLGYDHQNEEEAEAMEREEIQLLAQLGIANPYEES